jgi:hypothetical protein
VCPTETLEEVRTSRGTNCLKWLSGDLELSAWQNGYGAFSVSFCKIAEVRKYISNQINHHANMSFQEEYRMFLQKHGVGFDGAYVWD